VLVLTSDSVPSKTKNADMMDAALVTPNQFQSAIGTISEYLSLIVFISTRISSQVVRSDGRRKYFLL